MYKGINNFQTDISPNAHMLKCIWSMLCSRVQVQQALVAQHLPHEYHA